MEDDIDYQNLSDEKLAGIYKSTLKEMTRRYILRTEEEQLAQIQKEAMEARGDTWEDGNEWQPSMTHAQGYPKGAVVTLDNVEWTSIVPYNVWEPGKDGGHAWVRNQPEPEEPDAPPPWAEAVSYVPGDEVTHDGQVWRAKIAHISHSGWTPSIHTYAVWELVE